MKPNPEEFPIRQLRGREAGNSGCTMKTPLGSNAGLK